MAAVSVAALVLAACGDGEDDSVRPELQAAHDAMGQMIERADQGQVDEAEEAFEAIHDALHRIDSEVRDIDVSQAQELSGVVIDVEEELAGQRNASRLADLAREVLQQIERAAETLGLGPLGDE
jgi:hypothetical protein